MSIYRVHWSYLIQAPDARAAASRVWSEIFDQSPKPTEDQPCVFRVAPAKVPGRKKRATWVDLETDPDAELIDLAEKLRRVDVLEHDRDYVIDTAAAAQQVAAQILRNADKDPETIAGDPLAIYRTCIEVLARTPDADSAQIVKALEDSGLLRRNTEGDPAD